MYITRKLPVLLLLIAAAFSCNHPVNQHQNASIITNDTATIDGHPAWIMQGNIYEVNLRQYTPEGTFAAFAQSLPRLKKMGVQTLWFMPINPISKKDRKGELGSYYAIANYKMVNPDYGTMQDWINLVKKCHQMGFKVMMDWVANHTGADNYWIKKHPDFYVHDSTGAPLIPHGWDDVRQLNFNNQAMEDSMINCMKFWIKKSNIDGFRCDYAVGPPASFWKRCIDSLKKIKNVFMLAEADQPYLHKVGFDATYTWTEFNTMKLIAKGKRPATSLDSNLVMVDSTYPANAIKMYFTSNHDENSWNGADYKTMPGASHAPFAVLTQTLERSVPLIYSGQEEPVLDSISFFYKDPIHWGKYARASFYSVLLHLRTNNPALAANAPFFKLKTNKDKAIFAFVRKMDGHKVVVLTNLTKNPQHFTIKDTLMAGTFHDIFNNNQVIQISADTTFKFPAWGYKVYAY